MNSARNIYRQDVDFRALALEEPRLAKFLKINGQLDFTDPNAVRELTKALLHRDFGLVAEFPDDRLCPPVPNRFNYILWLQDLLDSTVDEDREADRDVVGLDIGTGASCIYPLLACAQRKNWRFAATDVDDENIEYAQENVTRNDLESRIRVIKVSKDDPLIPLGQKIPLESMEFTMCNPPFYESQEEMLASAEAKKRPPYSACTGAAVEMVTPGGEVAFVTRMIDESVELGESVQWYTTMLGKLSSVAVLVEKLQAVGNNNWAVTELVQGNKTRRWAIAWSWGDRRPTMDVARDNISAIPKHLLPFPSEFTFCPKIESISFLIKKINEEIKPLDIAWHWDEQASRGVGFAMDNVWSRQARRKRQLSAEEGIDTGSTDDVDKRTAALGFAVHARQTGIENFEVIVRWLKGSDSVLFESFCGMLKRKVEGR